MNFDIRKTVNSSILVLKLKMIYHTKRRVTVISNVQVRLIRLCAMYRANISVYTLKLYLLSFNEGAHWIIVPTHFHSKMRFLKPFLTIEQFSII